MSDPNDPYEQLANAYEAVVVKKHPTRARAWPLLTGYNGQSGTYKGWSVFILKDTGVRGIRSYSGMGELDPAIIGFDEINPNNIVAVRGNVERNLNVLPRDGVVIVNPQGQVPSTEFDALLLKHETALGLSPMKIFMSHKGVDKPMVRDFVDTLKALGFDPWLDDDAMPSGTSLERGIRKGFEESCAAVFFITPSFKDEKWLAAEVDYAIEQKRKRGDAFAIITLSFSDEHGNKGTIPTLLTTYVYKEPATSLLALREILRALPIKVGSITWRS